MLSFPKPGISVALDIQIRGEETQSLVNALNEFVGVSDPLGIITVSFTNLGFGPVTSTWGIDNVTTASGVAGTVPEPTTLAIFGLGLAGLG